MTDQGSALFGQASSTTVLPAGGITHNATELDELLVPIRKPDTENPNPEVAASSKRLGDEAFVKQDYPSAMDHYSTSIQHDASNPIVWANRAAASLKMNKHTLAYWDARMARSIDRNYVKAWYREGAALTAQGRHEDAAQVLYTGYMHNQSSEELALAVKEAVVRAREQVKEEKKREGGGGKEG